MFKPNGTEVPPIPRSPTKEDALAALEVLQSPIDGFPFVTDADRSVALSALLTSVCRTALQTVPLHATSAPTAGSGKTTLIDLASVLRTGRVAATVAQGRTTEELEKRLGAMLEADFIEPESLPSEMRERFVNPDGVYRVEIIPEADLRNPAALPKGDRKNAAR